MAIEAAFSAEEWDLLVRLPKWVARAASQAQADRGRRSADEEEAGFLAVADGRRSGSPLVGQIAHRSFETFDDVEPPDLAVDFADREAGIAGTLARAETAVRLLHAKAGEADAAAYRRWLVTIAETVVGTARSGDLVGIGGDSVSKPERMFLDGLAQALRG